MIPEKSERYEMLEAIRTLLRMVERSYIEEENRRYEGGFVPEDGSLRSDATHIVFNAVSDLIEADLCDE